MKRLHDVSQSAFCCLAFLVLMFSGAVAPADIIITPPPMGADYVPTTPVTGLPPGATGTVTLTPAKVGHLNAPAVGSDFMNTFVADVAQYPGWTAVTGAALTGTFTVARYQALSPTGNPNLMTPNGGARLQGSYAVNAADGFALTDLKWIQMYTETNPGGGAGVRHIDPFPNDDNRPWYLTAAEDGGTLANFSDRPGDHISAIPFSRSVVFETYLASFNNTTKVATIHDGFSWGYQINVVPEPSSWLLMLVGVGVLAFRLTRRRAPE